MQSGHFEIDRAPARVAITGASGFIGRHLQALTQGTGLGRADADGGARIIKTDYSLDDLTQKFAGHGAVVHLAGVRTERGNTTQTLASFLMGNSVLTETVAKAAVAAQVRRLVVVSTTACYSPQCPVPYAEANAAVPLNDYGLSKLAAEHAAQLVTRGTATGLVVLRLAAVYGLGEKLSPAIMTMIDRASRGEPIELKGNRNAAIDSVYIKDVLTAIVTAATGMPELVGVFNIGSGVAVPVRQIAEMIVDVFGGRSPIVDNSFDGPAQDRQYMEISKAKTDLGWQPRFTLPEGVRDFRDQMQVQG